MKIQDRKVNYRNDYFNRDFLKICVGREIKIKLFSDEKMIIGEFKIVNWLFPFPMRCRMLHVLLTLRHAKTPKFQSLDIGIVYLARVTYYNLIVCGHKSVDIGIVMPNSKR